MNVKDRLLRFLKHIDLSQGKFEDKVGLSRGFVNNMGKGINSGSLNKISEVYPELNTTWLTTGEGDMLLQHEEVFDIGIAIKKVEATADVTLAAVAEILARLTDKTVTSVRDDLEKMVRNKLNSLG